jgi:hypothetical protein
MAPAAEPVVRNATHDDVSAICRFGDAHIRPHYAPLIGAAAADEQVRRELLDALIGELPADADRLYIEHFVGNERAGAFYEREGFSVERIDPSPTGNPALGVVWRARTPAARGGASADRCG